MSREEKQRRYRLVEELMNRGVPGPTIVQACAREGMSQATVYRYRDEVWRAWEAERIMNAPHVANARRERLQRLVLKLENEKKYSAMVQIERLLNEMTGVNAPVQHEVKAAVAVAQVVLPIEPDVVGLDEEMLGALERAVEKVKQQRALTAPPEVVGDARAVTGG